MLPFTKQCLCGYWLVAVRLRKQCLEAVKRQQEYNSCIRQEKLAEKAKVTQPIVSRFLSCNESISERNFEKIIKHLFGNKAKWSDYGDYFEYQRSGSTQTAENLISYEPIPKNIRYTKHTERFRGFINSRLNNFVGRQYVFDEIKDFQVRSTSGYITILGNPGDGKSAIAANYLNINPDNNIFYFNIRKSDENTVTKYLKSTCGQLNERFGLNMPQDDPENWQNGNFLNQLMVMASSRLEVTGAKLMVVIDALDEAAPTLSNLVSPNPLYLPQQLRPNIYCLLTRRQTYTIDGIDLRDTRHIDLTSPEYIKRVNDDVEKYVRKYLGHPEDGILLHQQLLKIGKTKEDFIKIMIDKSKGNFMYLTLVMFDIVKGKYQELENLERLPETLEEYYIKHWELLDMDNNKLPRYVLGALLSSKNAITLDTVANYLKDAEPSITADAIKPALENWWQFLQTIHTNSDPRFEIYHESFREFLSRKIDEDKIIIRSSQISYFESI